MIGREMSGNGGDGLDFGEIAMVRQAETVSSGSFEACKRVRSTRLRLS